MVQNVPVFEHDIALLVYDLYGLTPEEIAIVEGTNYALLTEQLQLSEFVQSQTAQIVSHPIVQLPTAQFHSTQVPALLCLATYTSHVEILNRCNDESQNTEYKEAWRDEYLKWIFC